jgi:hypothetical protein
MTVVLILSAVIGAVAAGLIVPDTLRVAANRRAKAQEAAAALAEDERRAQRREKRTAKRVARERRRAAQQEIAEIQADPERHIYRMTLNASPRILTRREEQRAAGVTLARAAETREAGDNALATFDDAHPWVSKDVARSKLTWTLRVAIPLSVIALILDTLIMVAVEGPLGVIYGPLFFCAVALGSIGLCTGIGLFEPGAKPFDSRPRGLAFFAGGLLLVGALAMMMNWAPTLAAKVYDEKITAAQIQLADLQRQPADSLRDSEITALKTNIAKLQETEGRIATGSQFLVGMLAIGEAAATEALMLTPLLRRRQKLQRAREEAQAKVQAAEDSIPALETALKIDITRMTERMLDELTQAGFTLDESRQIIADVLARQGDLTLFQRLLSEGDAEGNNDNETPALSPADSPGDVVEGEVVPGPFEDAITTDDPARTEEEGDEFRRANGPNDTPPAEPHEGEVPMPPQTDPVLNLDDLDQSN